MKSLLLVLPLVGVLIAVYLYRFIGRREVLKFDFIQFLYAFVISPIAFISLKSFLFVTLRESLGIKLTLNEYFAIDTLLTVIALYIFGFIVIHALTVSFKLVMTKDPLADLFPYSEYFHLWLSHIVIFIGLGFLITILSILNLNAPISFVWSKLMFDAALAFAAFVGIAGYIAISNADPNQAGFMKIMKLFIGLFFLIHSAVYLVWTPTFSSSYMVYWGLFTILSVMVICSLIDDRSLRATHFFDSFKHKNGWGENITLFDKNKNEGKVTSK